MTTDTLAPTWAQRSDAFRTTDVRTFDDVYGIVDGTFRTYSKLYETLGPYNAKQNNSSFPYQPPSREFLQMALKRPARGLSDFVYSAMLAATIRFCETHKGKRQLITPHPSSHHSAHFPEGMFEIKYMKSDFPALHKTQNKTFKAATVAQIKIDGIDEPIYVENLKERPYKYIIVRPKLGKLGTANIQNWEVLFYTRNFGFNLEHCDSNLNPRYSGLI